MKQRERVGLWSAALAAILFFFFGKLLDPRSALTARDMIEFHLPLRLAWTKLAAFSFFPQWDPFAHGGQPLLSNPNYGALYPLSWIARFVPVTFATNLLVVVHAGLAAWGCERLARRMGADRPSALLAAIAYSCGPTYLSLLYSLPLALGMSWLPWVLAFTLDRIARTHSDLPSDVSADPREAARAARQSLLGLALSTGMLVITGDPVLLVMTALALAVMLAGPPLLLWRRFRAIAVPLALGFGLASVQLLPTLARLAESPRAHGLPWGDATSWSLPWKRLPEFLFPTFYGDSSRPTTGLYFGWGIHDRDFPYLVLLAIGTPLLLLALAGMTRWRTKWSLPTVALSALGLLLALGRHDPLYRFLWEYAPGFGAIRYPEKFALLALTAMVLLGALTWKRILDQRDREPARGAELPFALAALLAAAAAAFVFLTHRLPNLIESFLAGHSGWLLPPAKLAEAADYFRNESRFALAIALSALVLFALARWSRLPRRLLEVAAIVVLVAELSATARPLVRTMPAIDYLRPPAIAREIRSGPGRLFSNQAYRAGREELVVNAGNVIENSLRAPLDRLHSRTANLFDKSYALDVDFDLTFTRPAARALAFYERLRDEPDLAHRMLGAWSVEQVLIGRAPEAMIADIRHGRSQPAHVSIAPNGYYLPQIRFIPRYRAFGTAGRAEAAAFKARIPLNREEFLIEPVHAAADDGLPVELSVGRLLKDEDRADQRTIEYASESPALLVVATTFDRRWRAAIAARRLPIFETAGGYMAIPVPAGEHRLELEFRDPWFAVGAAVTLLAALLLVLVAFVPRARPAAPEPRRTMP